MDSYTIRNPHTEQLLSPENSAFIIIDYQPIQVSSIRSMPRDELVFNIVSTAKCAVNFNLPIVHSTVNIATGRNKPPIQKIQDVLGHLPTYDRTSINSWEDTEFKRAVKAIGRRKLIMTALWTEACLTFPALDAIQEGLRSMYPSMRSAARRSLRMRRRCAGWSRPAQSSSAGCKCTANSSVTGRATRPCSVSWTCSRAPTASTLKRRPRRRSGLKTAVTAGISEPLLEPSLRSRGEGLASARSGRQPSSCGEGRDQSHEYTPDRGASLQSVVAPRWPRPWIPQMRT